MQGTVIWRARLPIKQVPSFQLKMFLEKDMMGMIYPISDEQCVWTVCAPVQKVIDAGVTPKPAKASSAISSATPTATPPATVVAPPNGKPCSAEELALQRAAAGRDVIQVSCPAYLGCVLQSYCQYNVVCVV